MPQDPEQLDMSSLYPPSRAGQSPRVEPPNTLLDEHYRKRRLGRALQKKKDFLAAHDAANLSDAGKWSLGYLNGRINALAELESDHTEKRVLARLNHTEGELEGYLDAGTEVAPLYMGELHGAISVFEDIVQTYEDIRDADHLVRRHYPDDLHRIRKQNKRCR